MKALVVGGTSAIGEEIIKRLVELEYQVNFTYFNNSDKAETLSHVYGSNCRMLKLDLSDLNEVAQFVRNIPKDDTPDVLVNVAGITRDALSIGDISGDLRSVHTVNFLSPVTICSGIAELMMQKRRGHIINISSAAARNPRSGNAAYGSAKIALERFTASLALEIARFKVRTLCIAPAFVDTPMYRKFANGREKEILKMLPLREVLSVEDIANSVVAFVDGQIKTTGSTLALTNGHPAF